MTNQTSVLVHFALLEFGDIALLFIWIGLSTFLTIGIIAITKRLFSFCCLLFYR